MNDLATVSEIFQEATAHFRIVGREEMLELVALFEEDAHIIESVYLDELEKGTYLPPLVLEGGKSRAA